MSICDSSTYISDRSAGINNDYPDRSQLVDSDGSVVLTESPHLFDAKHRVNIAANNFGISR